LIAAASALRVEIDEDAETIYLQRRSNLDIMDEFEHGSVIRVDPGTAVIAAGVALLADVGVVAGEGLKALELCLQRRPSSLPRSANASACPPRPL